MQHKELAAGRWAELSFPQQMANIGSETYRTLTALLAGKESRAESAFARAQELFDLTIRYGRQGESPAARDAMWEEVCRLREIFCDAVLSRDFITLEWIDKYLDQFAKVKPDAQMRNLVARTELTL